MKRIVLGCLLLASLIAAGSWPTRAQQPGGDGPRYTNGNNLIRPANYREWIFLGSGLGMTYDEPRATAPASPSFTNVFVNPSSYRAFMQSGKWPDGSIFVLEARASSGEASINKAGRFQAAFAALEVEVKDSRFPDGWAFFDLGNARAPKEIAEPLSGDRVAPCVDCHTKHTAVERTFVQFYPTLMEVAQRLGTINPGYGAAK